MDLLSKLSMLAIVIYVVLTIAQARLPTSRGGPLPAAQDLWNRIRTIRQSTHGERSYQIRFVVLSIALALFIANLIF
jgi:hypothetical protein